MAISKLTGILLILLPIAFNVVFFLLQRRFEYPDILRQPTGYILERFHQSGRGLIGLWYAFVATALLFIPAAILVPQVLAPHAPIFVASATTIGVLAGLVQALGLIRWPFVVPYLSRTFADPTASPATRDAVAVVFQSLHRYAGVATGEHLGYLFTSLWTILVALAMARSPQFPAWLGYTALIPAAGIFAGLFEEAGFRAAGAINAISYILWSIWLIAVGVAFLLL